MSQIWKKLTTLYRENNAFEKLNKEVEKNKKHAPPPDNINCYFTENYIFISFIVTYNKGV